MTKVGPLGQKLDLQVKSWTFTLKVGPSGQRYFRTKVGPSGQKLVLQVKSTGSKVGSSGQKYFRAKVRPSDQKLVIQVKSTLGQEMSGYRKIGQQL
jgi:hypothetical protein